MKTLLGLMGMAVLIGVPQANATVEVRIINVGVADSGWITCAGDTCTASGIIGNYKITSDITARSDPDNPFLDMAYSATTFSAILGGAAPGDLIIEAMADGYTNNSPGFQLLADGNTTLKGTERAAAYGGNTNDICAAGFNLTCWYSGANEAPVGTGSALIASGSFAAPGGPSSFHVDQNGPGNTVNPYSLGLIFTMKDITGPGSASGDIQLNAVPEPTSILLLGAVLLYTASALRRRVRPGA